MHVSSEESAGSLYPTLPRPDRWGAFKVSPAFKFQRDAKSVPIPAGLADQAQPGAPCSLSLSLQATDLPGDVTPHDPPAA